jgi:hypothetical protein
MDVEQAVAAHFSGPPAHSASQQVTITSIPAYQSVTENDQFGGSITSTYSITDNGSIATFDISSTGSVTAYDNGVEEVPNKDINFSILEPVAYTVVVEATGSGDENFEAAGALSISTGELDPSETFNGLASPHFS